MDRRIYLLLTGGSLVLVAALLATPLWDLWYYRPLRSSPGSYVPVAVVVSAPADSPYRYPEAPRAIPTVAAAESMRVRPAVPPLAGTARPARPPSQRPGRAPDAPVVPVAARITPRHDRATVVPKSEAKKDDSIAPPVNGPIDEPEATGEAPPAPPPAAFYLTRTTPPPPEIDAGPPRRDDPPRHGAGPARIMPPPDDLDPEPSAGPPVVSLVPDSFELSPGEAVVVAVQVSDAVSMSSLPFHLTFDPEVLEFVDSQPGSALAGAHEPILLASVNPNRPGDLAVGLSLVESSGLFSGSGVLVRLRFRALAQGESDLDFDRASLRGATSQPLGARFERTSIKVR